MLLGRLPQQAWLRTKLLWRLNCGSTTALVIIQEILLIKAHLLGLKHSLVELCLRLVLARVDLLEAA